MVIKSLLAIGGALVLFMVGSLVKSQFFPSDAAPAVERHRPEPKLKPWSGSATHTYNLSFNRKGDKLSLGSVDFARLQTATSAVQVHLYAEGLGGQRPAWLKPSSFGGIRPSGTTLPPTSVQIIPQGPGWAVTVVWAAVPTDALGPTRRQLKAARQTEQPLPSEAANPLLLRLGIPGGPAYVRMNAPPPPPGHYLLDYVLIAKAREAAANAVKVGSLHISGKHMSATGTLSAAAASAKQLVVLIDGQVRRMVPARSPFTIQIEVAAAGRHTLKVGYAAGTRKVYPAGGVRGFTIRAH